MTFGLSPQELLAMLRDELGPSWWTVPSGAGAAAEVEAWLADAELVHRAWLRVQERAREVSELRRRLAELTCVDARTGEVARAG